MSPESNRSEVATIKPGRFRSRYEKSEGLDFCLQSKRALPHRRGCRRRRSLGIIVFSAYHFLQRQRRERIGFNLFWPNQTSIIRPCHRASERSNSNWPLLLPSDVLVVKQYEELVPQARASPCNFF